MSSTENLNQEFIIDAKTDIDNIYQYFIANASLENLKLLPYIFNIESISKNNHRKQKEFTHTFFQIILLEIEESIVENNIEKFMILIVILKAVFFKQSNIYVQIIINVTKVESISNFLITILNTCMPVYLQMIQYCVWCFEQLKAYGAFNVIGDDHSICIQGEDVESVMKEIDQFQEELKDLEDRLSRQNRD